MTGSINEGDFDEYVTTVRKEETGSLGISMCLWGNVHRTISDVSFLLDCGATISLLSRDLFEEIPESERPTLIPNFKTVGASNGGSIKHIG